MAAPMTGVTIRSSLLFRALLLVHRLTLKPYLAIILAATELPPKDATLGGGATSVFAGGLDSTREGGGAIATPALRGAPNKLGLGTPPSSSSSLEGRADIPEGLSLSLGSKRLKKKNYDSQSKQNS